MKNNNSETAYNSKVPPRQLEPHRGQQQSIDYTNQHHQKEHLDTSELTQKEEDRKLQKKVQELVWFFQNSSGKSSHRSKLSKTFNQSQASSLPFKKSQQQYPQSSKSQMSHSSIASIEKKQYEQSSSSPNLKSYSSNPSSKKQVKSLKAAISYNTSPLKKFSKTPTKGRNTPSSLKGKQSNNIKSQMSLTSSTQISSYQTNKKAVGSLQHSSTTSMIGNGNPNSLNNRLQGVLYNQNTCSSILSSKLPNLKNNNFFNSINSTESQTNSPSNNLKSSNLPFSKGSSNLIGSGSAMRNTNTSSVRSYIGDSTSLKKSDQQSRNIRHNFNPSGKEASRNMTLDELDSGKQNRFSPQSRKKTPIKGKGFGYNIAQQKKNFPAQIKSSNNGFSRQQQDTQQSLSNEQSPQFNRVTKYKSPSPVKPSPDNLQKTLKKRSEILRKKNQERLGFPKFEQEDLEGGSQEQPKRPQQLSYQQRQMQLRSQINLSKKNFGRQSKGLNYRHQHNNTIDEQQLRIATAKNNNQKNRYDFEHQDDDQYEGGVFSDGGIRENSLSMRKKTRGSYKQMTAMTPPRLSSRKKQRSNIGASPLIKRGRSKSGDGNLTSRSHKSSLSPGSSNILHFALFKDEGTVKYGCVPVNEQSMKYPSKAFKSFIHSMGSSNQVQQSDFRSKQISSSPSERILQGASKQKSRWREQQEDSELLRSQKSAGRSNFGRSPLLMQDDQNPENYPDAQAAPMPISPPKLFEEPYRKTSGSLNRSKNPNDYFNTNRVPDSLLHKAEDMPYQKSNFVEYGSPSTLKNKVEQPLQSQQVPTEQNNDDSRETRIRPFDLGSSLSQKDLQASSLQASRDYLPEHFQEEHTPIKKQRKQYQQLSFLKSSGGSDNQLWSSFNKSQSNKLKNNSRGNKITNSKLFGNTPATAIGDDSLGDSRENSQMVTPQKYYQEESSSNNILSQSQFNNEEQKYRDGEEEEDDGQQENEYEPIRTQSPVIYEQTQFKNFPKSPASTSNESHRVIMNSVSSSKNRNNSRVMRAMMVNDTIPESMAESEITNLHSTQNSQQQTIESDFKMPQCNELLVDNKRQRNTAILVQQMGGGTPNTQMNTQQADNNSKYQKPRIDQTIKQEQIACNNNTIKQESEQYQEDQFQDSPVPAQKYRNRIGSGGSYLIKPSRVTGGYRPSITTQASESKRNSEIQNRYPSIGTGTYNDSRESNKLFDFTSPEQEDQQNQFQNQNSIEYGRIQSGEKQNSLIPQQNSSDNAIDLLNLGGDYDDYGLARLDSQDRFKIGSLASSRTSGADPRFSMKKMGSEVYSFGGGVGGISANNSYNQQIQQQHQQQQQQQQENSNLSGFSRDRSETAGFKKQNSDIDQGSDVVMSLNTYRSPGSGQKYGSPEIIFTDRKEFGKKLGIDYKDEDEHPLRQKRGIKNMIEPISAVEEDSNSSSPPRQSADLSQITESTSKFGRLPTFSADQNSFKHSKNKHNTSEVSESSTSVPKYSGRRVPFNILQEKSVRKSNFRELRNKLGTSAATIRLFNALQQEAAMLIQRQFRVYKQRNRTLQQMSELNNLIDLCKNKRKNDGQDGKRLSISDLNEMEFKNSGVQTDPLPELQLFKWLRGENKSKDKGAKKQQKSSRTAIYALALAMLSFKKILA